MVDQQHEVRTGTGGIARFSTPERAADYAEHVEATRRNDARIMALCYTILAIACLFGLWRYGSYWADVVACVLALMIAGIWFIIWRFDRRDQQHDG